MFVMLIHVMIHAMAACNPVPSDAVCPHGWEPQAGAGGALQFGVGLGLGCHDWAVACLHFCFARCLTLCVLRTQVAQIAEGGRWLLGVRRLADGWGIAKNHRM